MSNGRKLHPGPEMVLLGVKKKWLNVLPVNQTDDDDKRHRPTPMPLTVVGSSISLVVGSTNEAPLLHLAAGRGHRLSDEDL